MKKYVSLVLSILALISNFICFWYSDELINRLFVFGVIPIGICIIILLISLMVSVNFAIRNKSKIKRYLPLLISLITVVLVFVFPFRTAKVNLELNLYEKDRLEIIEMVKNGDIVADKFGNAKLPKGYGRLSSDGEIFIYQNDGNQVITFWVFRGMLSGSIELIYSSTDESLIYENETGHPITSVRKLKEHWYLVNTDY